MNLQDFIKRFTGVSNVGDTEANKGECVGLVQEWINTLGTPHIWGHAKDLINNYDPDFYEVILNTPDAIPQAGDIIVWGIKFNNTFGHTAIATGKGDLNTFEVFEQNNPLGSKPHIDTYNYNHVVGWLRPKVSIVNNDQQKVIDELRIARDKNWNLYQAEVEKVKNLDQINGRLLEEVEDLREQVDFLGDELEDYETDLAKCRLQVNTSTTSSQVPSTATTVETPSNQAQTDFFTGLYLWIRNFFQR